MDSGFLEVVASAPAYIPDDAFMENNGDQLLEFMPGRMARLRQRIHIVPIRGEKLAAYSVILTWIWTGELSPTKWYLTPRSAEITPSLLKRVYDIACQVELPKLQALVLRHFTRLLDASNVLPMLLSNSCLVYPKLKTAAKEVALKHWSEIVKAGGTDALVEIDQTNTLVVEMVKELWKQTVLQAR